MLEDGYYFRRGARGGYGLGRMGLRVRYGCGWCGDVDGQWLVRPDHLSHLQHHVSVKGTCQCASVMGLVLSLRLLEKYLLI